MITPTAMSPGSTVSSCDDPLGADDDACKVWVKLAMLTSLTAVNRRHPLGAASHHSDQKVSGAVYSIGQNVL